jgi:hypothetical protein
MACFGYVIGGTHQCSVGCFDDCSSLKRDLLFFGNSYVTRSSWHGRHRLGQRVRRQGQRLFEHVTWSSGRSERGRPLLTSQHHHPEEGETSHAVLFLPRRASNITDYDIRAAVLHHVFTHSFPASTISFLDMTGEELDSTAPATEPGVTRALARGQA